MKESTATTTSQETLKVHNLSTDQNKKFTLLSHSALSISGKKTWKNNKQIYFFMVPLYLRECQSKGVIVWYYFFAKEFHDIFVLACFVQCTKEKNS